MQAEILDLEEPMGCSSVVTVEELKGDLSEYVMEPKYDGFRLIAVVGEDDVVFFTRAGKRQDGKLPHLVEQLRRVFPPGTVLDGEIIAPCVYRDDGSFMLRGGGTVDTQFEYVQSVMLSLPERAVLVQEEHGYLDYAMFDIPMYGGARFMDMPLEKRVEHMRMLCANCTKNVHVQRPYPCSQEINDWIVQMGFEGTVAKRRDSLYVWGGKGKGWFKIKPEQTIDAVIVGFHEGEGKFAGLVGSIVFGQPVSGSPVEFSVEAGKFLESDLGTVKIEDDMWITYVIRGSCSGMTDEVRKHVTENRDELLGTVIEVGHKGVMAGGVRFRFPQFKRFRPDRTAKSIGWHDR